jgi:hypothetical protein
MPPIYGRKKITVHRTEDDQINIKITDNEQLLEEITLLMSDAMLLAHDIMSIATHRDI